MRPTSLHATAQAMWSGPVLVFDEIEDAFRVRWQAPCAFFTDHAR
jgi:hypothetical protein